MDKLTRTSSLPFGTTWADRGAALVLSAAATGAIVGLGWLTVVAWPVMVPLLGVVLTVVAGLHCLFRVEGRYLAQRAAKDAQLRAAHKEFIHEIRAGIAHAWQWDTWLVERYPHLAD